MEGSCSTGQSPQWAVVPVEEEEEEEEEEEGGSRYTSIITLTSALDGVGDQNYGPVALTL
jgi:hypothetical protein